MGTGGVFLRKLRARISDRPTGFVWVVDDRVAASGLPASRNQILWLTRQGIAAVLTLTEDPLPASSTEGFSIQLEHVAMKDHGVPSAMELDRGVKFVTAQVEAGRKVLVHCLAGEGRTGCVLAAYVMVAKKTSPQQALSTIRKVKPEFVEARQEQAVIDYASALAEGPAES